MPSYKRILKNTKINKQKPDFIACYAYLFYIIRCFFITLFYTLLLIPFLSILFLSNKKLILSYLL